MRRAARALRFISKDDALAILSGRMTATIRLDALDIQKGDSLILCCPYTNWCCQATVMDVFTTPVGLLVEDQIVKTNLNSLDDVYEMLSACYGHTDSSDETAVTFIEWSSETLRGALVSERFDSSLQD